LAYLRGSVVDMVLAEDEEAEPARELIRQHHPTLEGYGRGQPLRPPEDDDD
jgi:hypothetical protein